MRTPISWVGNKTSILPIVYSVFPLDYERYIEPFGGSGAVLLGKNSPDKFEVLNDFNGDLVNLFLCIRERPIRLIRELGFCTLNSRDDFKVLKAIIEKSIFEVSFLEEELELTRIMLPELQAEELVELQRENAKRHDVRRAANFLKMLRFSYASTGKSYASQPFSLLSLFDLIHLASKRLDKVVIENQDFETLIKHYDRSSSFFYCDPPYVDTENFYEGGFNMDSHIRLRDTLFNIKGKFLVSYNDCPTIKELYKGCDIIGFTRIHPMAQKFEAGKEFHELLIANYDIFEREKQKPYQLNFFESGRQAEINRTMKGNIIQYGKRDI